MRGLKFAVICLAMAAGLVSAPAAGAQEKASILGFWRNPKNSVHVEIKPCGPKTCGYVVWASDKAKADAREKGNELIGMQVLRDFVPAKDGDWKGKVFAPDLGMTFSGTAQFIDAAALKARGCVLGNFLCKSQTWRRIDSAAG